MSNRKIAPINIISQESVNLHQDEAQKIGDDPAMMLRLVDLIFGFQEDQMPPS